MIQLDGPAVPSTPTTPQDMAALTGESVRTWRNVEVTVDDHTLIVFRTGAEAATWMLHDLLLAEAAADSLR